MKVWQKKNIPLNREIETFTIDKDIVYDQYLVEADCLASIAHAKMLQGIGVITGEEFKKIKEELLNIIELESKGKFNIVLEDEDVHSKIENHLTGKLGEMGKKIHTARSRNEVLVTLRLYSKGKILGIEELLLKLCNALLNFAAEHEFQPMPGYTHMRRAMPSSAGLWAASFVESLLDDLVLVKTAYQLNNQNPLGSAAGYGVSLDIDRELTTKFLGFGKVQNNVLYVQNSRGKIESIILSALMQVSLDLNRLANDLILFSTAEYNFMELPKEFCTGSSIMPQKWNPDVLELVRGKSATMQSYLMRVTTTINSLPSGYNRDGNLTKEPFMEGLQLAESILSICSLVIPKLKVNKDAMEKACSPELFATDAAIKLVKEGMPFREAYLKVAESGFGSGEDAAQNIKSKKHVGATGNLGLEKLRKIIAAESTELEKESTAFNETIKKIGRL